jgi:hypothetical protein
VPETPIVYMSPLAIPGPVKWIDSTVTGYVRVLHQKVHVNICFQKTHPIFVYIIMYSEELACKQSDEKHGLFNRMKRYIS